MKLMYCQDKALYEERMVLVVRQIRKTSNSKLGKSVILLLMLAALLAGCNSASASASVDVQTFNIPNSFSLSDNGEDNCSIINETGATVGGITKTNLKAKDITSPNSIALAQYLNLMNEGCEYISWNDNSSNYPTKHVSQYVTSSDASDQREIYHVLFIKDKCVFDIWFDTKMIKKDTITEFVSIVIAE